MKAILAQAKLFCQSEIILPKLEESVYGSDIGYHVHDAQECTCIQTEFSTPRYSR